MELKDYLELPYTITLRRDESGDWIARIQELKGCTADGATREEALADLDRAKREWLAAALEDGIPIPAPEQPDALPSGKWVQRVPRSLHKALAQIARAEGTSLNQLVSAVLARHVGETSKSARTNNVMIYTQNNNFVFAGGWQFAGAGQNILRAVTTAAITGDLYSEKK